MRFYRHGGPEVLRVEDAPMPTPGPGEVRVRTDVIGVGIPDILVRTNTDVKQWDLPMVPGNDVAGWIDAVGLGVVHHKEGDRVYVSSREMPKRGGGYAEYRVVPAAAPFRLPDSISSEDAVSLGNFQLGWMLLNTPVSPQPGQSILVHAASGGVGSGLVQLAKHLGLRVFGTARGEEKKCYVEQLGADAAIDRLSEDVGDKIHELTSGAGLDVIYDPVAGPNFAENFQMLRQGGTVVLFGFLGGASKADLYSALTDDFTKCLGLRVFSIHSVDDKPEIRRHAMEQVMDAMASGTLRSHTHAVLPLEQAAQAHEIVEAGGHMGKVLLTCQ